MPSVPMGNSSVPCTACGGSGKVTVVHEPRAFYFGCGDEAGHYLFNHRMRRERWPWSGGASPFPWDRIDGRLNPEREVEGQALLHHKDGWTALAFADRTVDRRPGSNSTFIFEQILDFEGALAEARRVFPKIVERVAFEIVPAPAGSEPRRRR